MMKEITDRRKNNSTNSVRSNAQTRWNRYFAAFLSASICLFASAVSEILAAPGDLDLSFGSGGKVLSTGVTTGSGGISDLAIQPDGKIVAVGEVKIVRYNANGSLDSSFGSGGIVFIQLDDNISGFASSVAIQADGKIVVAGGSWNAETGYSFAVVRYNPNGTLDTTFNGTGKIFNPDQGGYATATAIQADGKIVVIGYGLDVNEEWYSAVYRYNSNGSPDTSFNGTGSIINPNSSVASVAIQPDGKIIVGGSSPNSYKGWHDIWISRYNADGSPDTSFCGGGGDGTCILFNSFGWGAAYGLAIQSDGKIVAKVSGWENGDFGDYPVTILTRRNPNGSHDLFRDEHYLPHAGDLAIQPDGKIVSASASSYNDSDFAVRRYNPNGFRDTTFGGGDGLVTTDFGCCQQAEAFAVAIQADGKLVAAGVARYYQPDGTIIHHFALARYHSTQSAPFDYDGDGRSDYSVWRPSEGTWYLSLSQTGSYVVQPWGLTADKIVPSDYDGDGKTDMAVYRPTEGKWYVIYSQTNAIDAIQFGLNGDIPQPQDFDGDGKADFGVWRPSDGTWYLSLSQSGVYFVQRWGLTGDKPVAADYDGDGRSELAVWRPSEGRWYMNNLVTGGISQFNWGLNGDMPIVGDYSGDGRADHTVYRPSNQTWYRIHTDDFGIRERQWGLVNDIPAPGDFDGDGKLDLAVYRPSEGKWYVLGSTNAILSQSFGLNGDVPTESAFVY